MRTFFDQVAHALAVDDDLLLVGDGEVVEHFADQLLARIRTIAGSPAKRYLPR